MSIFFFLIKLNVFYIDVFSFCLCVAELCDGELIHGENFSLFAAMSALEVLILASSLFFCFSDYCLVWLGIV